MPGVTLNHLRGVVRATALVAAAVALGGCAAAASSSKDSGAAHRGQAASVRLGYFPNVTHATAIVGVKAGIFARALRPAPLQALSFNAGSAATEALLSGAIDACYVGPNPAINAFVQTHGQAVRIVSGTTSGGAALVVKGSTREASQLRGKKLATPELGNTQDVALRYWLLTKGLHTDPQGGGDVSILPEDNATILQSFKSGNIDGAWVPEPWVTRLVQEAGGKVLVDERSLWPQGRFVTAELVVRTDFLDQHPDLVEKLVQAQVRANDFVNRRPAEAQEVVGRAIGELTGKSLPASVVASSWANLTFTDDPLAASLTESAQHAKAVGFLNQVNLRGIYELSFLNRALVAAGELAVSGS